MARKDTRKHKTPDYDKFLRDIFASAQMPRAWLAVARNLRKAAEVLISSQRRRQKKFDDALITRKIPRVLPHYDEAYLLYSFALECGLKGLLANKRPPKSADELDGAFLSHNLDHLVDSIPFKISKDERRLLVTLSHFGIWRGRYPVPAAFHNLVPEIDGKPDPSGLLGRHEAIRLVYARIDKALTAVAK